MNYLGLVPPLIESGRVEDFTKAGQTLSVSQSPLDTSLCVFVSPTDASSNRSDPTLQEQPIYFASQAVAPVSERRLFVTDTLLIFTAFQKLGQTAGLNDSGWSQSGDNMAAMRKLAIDYVNFIKECWVHASQPLPRSEPLQFSAGQYRSLYTSFSLFVVLYLPEPGFEDIPVGEELMEWLNIHFIEPSTEEGDHLSALDRPWEDETFWPYLTRTILRGLSKASAFFLATLARHPSPYLRALAESLIPILTAQPLLRNFSSERDFTHAAHRWRDRVKGLRIEMDIVPEDERDENKSGDAENWWTRLSDIVGILEGRESVVLRVCEDLGADWKEVCAAWGIFVDTRLRRQDFPDIVAQAMDVLPPDPTNLEDMIHANLMSDKPEQALEYAARLDLWLAAHMADVMERLGMVDAVPDEFGEITIRDHYLLAYAESLRADASLWRLTVEYMVPLRLQTQNHQPKLQSQGAAEGGEGDENEEVKTGDIVGVLKEINETCLEHQREEVRRVVCRVAARLLIDAKQLGLAISYYTSAEDWAGVGYVANRVLQEFWTSGPLPFTKLAEDVASSIHSLAESGCPHVFVYRLIFAVRYGRFQQIYHMMRGRAAEGLGLGDALGEVVGMFEEGIAPRGWWAVLLSDVLGIMTEDPSALPSTASSMTLLRKLDEITAHTRSTSTGGSRGETEADDYLGILCKALNGDEKGARQCLQSVRLSLAKGLARRGPPYAPFGYSGLRSPSGSALEAYACLTLYTFPSHHLLPSKSSLRAPPRSPPLTHALSKIGTLQG
ncbi:hypothetical protein CCMSSC00406_0007681 [Pleurotus cornucopiae]|uniref:Uncharacterized protein n=1 Tax=Pleurotus cornucopiae TaxID=5321 RepID=A0ACB7J1C4_PLECO|nr:hypothetical protein CCMSSC00406_0007681 [Pleurotus cornucopiae]